MYEGGNKKTQAEAESVWKAMDRQERLAALMAVYQHGTVVVQKPAAEVKEAVGEVFPGLDAFEIAPLPLPTFEEFQKLVHSSVEGHELRGVITRAVAASRRLRGL